MELHDLYYEDGNIYSPLPEWGRFLVDLGEFLAEQDDVPNRLTVALILPTRPYAAALIGSSLVRARASGSTRSTQAVSEHFALLKQLPEGTTVKYYTQSKEGQKVLKAKFLGVRVENGVERIGILDTKKLNRWMTEAQAWNVKELSSEQAIRPVSPYRTSIEPGLAKFFLSEVNARDLTTQSKLECVIIGKISLLKREIADELFSVDEKGTFTAPLQSILRVQGFGLGIESYRSVALGVNSRLGDALPSLPPEGFTIFDGSASLIQDSSKWARHGNVVLLDRTESTFDTAVEIVNERFMGRTQEAGPRFLRKTPIGIESVMFRGNG